MTIEEAAIGNTNLFDRSEFISEQVQSTLPPRYLIRPLDRNDDQHGFIELLSQLSVVGNFTPELFKKRFDLMKQKGSSFVIVIEEQGVIVACATLLVEHKFLRECGNVGHIEDVVVHQSQRGKGLGLKLINQLYYIAERAKCYKTILNCNEKNIAFYEKCQLKKTDVQMTRYF